MNPNTAKRKGRATETLLIEWLHQNGVPYAERRRLTGTHDRGDIAGWIGVTVEVKSGAAITLGPWMAELAAEQANTGDDWGLLIIRPKNRPNPEHWWAVMPLRQALDLLEQ